MTSAIRTLIQSMPKAELHVHLEGTVTPPAMLDLARRHDMLDLLPEPSVEALEEWFHFRDFMHFVQIYMTIQSLLRSPEDFDRIVYDCGADMAEQNIRYRELTVTTFTHTHLQAKGLDIAQIFEGLEAGRLRARAAFGVEMAWVLDIPRNAAFRGDSYDPQPAQETLAHARYGLEMGAPVVGLGLGGYEVGAPPHPFAHAFAQAKEMGLWSLPHAGETVGPESVRGAVEDLAADRIGHGVRAIEDPALLLLLKERQIPLEISLVSNMRLGVYPHLPGHPLPHLDRMGLVVTVNSDDPPLFNTRLCEEYLNLHRAFAYGPADLIRLARNGLLSMAGEVALKRSLLDEFDTWASQVRPV